MNCQLQYGRREIAEKGIYVTETISAIEDELVKGPIESSQKIN